MKFYTNILKLTEKKDRITFNILILLNLVHFVLEFIAIASIPIFATLLIDKNIIFENIPFLSNFLGSEFIALKFGIFVSITFILKNSYLIYLIN